MVRLDMDLAPAEDASPASVSRSPSPASISRTASSVASPPDADGHALHTDSDDRASDADVDRAAAGGATKPDAQDGAEPETDKDERQRWGTSYYRMARRVKSAARTYGAAAWHANVEGPGVHAAAKAGAAARRSKAMRPDARK